MDQHDEYGKRLMRIACGDDWLGSGRSVEVDLGSGQPARIDGTIRGRIAVEIESRVSKQVLGAIFDLVLHSFKKKLLLLMPVHMNSPDNTRDQCIRIMVRLNVAQADFEAVLLKGHGDNPRENEDVGIIQHAIHKLG